MSDADGYSLLPGNASAFERGVERAFRRLIADVEVPFPHLLDPATTPARFLPYLAADRSVIEWQSSDSEATKRATVAQAWPIKKAAGTRAALRHAVESMGFEASIKAWHEQSPPGQPYHFTLRTRTVGTFTPDDFERLERRLTEARAERDTLEHTIAAEVRGPVTGYVGAYSGSEVTVYPYVATEGATEGAFAVGAAVHSTSTVTTVYPDPDAINPYE